MMRPASEAVARVARRIGHVVISTGMDHYRRAVGIQERARSRVERHIRDEVFNRLCKSRDAFARHFICTFSLVEGWAARRTA
jgi:hypothetical protein